MASRKRKKFPPSTKKTPLRLFMDEIRGGPPRVETIAEDLGITRQHVHALLVSRHPSLKLAIQLYRWSGFAGVLRPENWEPWL